MNRLPLLLILLLASFLTWQASAQVPQIISYQGRISVNGINFDGPGSFGFALVSGDQTTTTTYWSNDGTAVNQPPQAPVKEVSLTVSKGLYSVLLGDTSIANMTAIPPSVFTNPDVRLRVWFDDGTHGLQQLAPQFGLIAEEVEKIDPDLVVHDAKGQVFTVRYEAVNAMLLNEFLKEHRTVEAQAREMATQQQALAKAGQRVEELESTVSRQAEQIKALSAGLQSLARRLLPESESSSPEGK